MAKQQYGIKNLKELASFANAGTTAVRNLKERGIKLTGANIFRILPELLPAIGLAEDAFEDAGEIPKELSELSKGEKREVYGLIDEGVHVGDPKKEKAIERLLKALIEVADATLELTGAGPSEEDEEE